jgi:hypothetical protein
MRSVDKVSCPFTYGVLNDQHRQWCVDVAGGHCRNKDCRWRSETFADVPQKSGTEKFEQGRLF